MRPIRIALAAVAIATTASLSAIAVQSAGANATRGRAQVAQAASHATLTADIVAARLATARYATSLAAAKAAGYQILTRMIPDMGYHFLNPKVKRFDVRKPPILVYEHHGRAWQLGALEWVFTSKPAKPPLPGAQYGTFPAACHYVDGTFVPESAQSMCPSRSPQTGAAFKFWHSRLITLTLLDLVPEPVRALHGNEPNGQPVQPGLRVDRLQAAAPRTRPGPATNQKPTVLRLIVIDRGDQALRESVGA